MYGGVDYASIIDGTPAASSALEHAAVGAQIDVVRTQRVNGQSVYPIVSQAGIDGGPAGPSINTPEHTAAVGARIEGGRRNWVNPQSFYIIAAETGQAGIDGGPACSSVGALEHPATDRA